MIQKHMDGMYFNMSELNTKQFEILGYTLCSRAAKCLEKCDWQPEQLWAAIYICLLLYTAPSSYFFLLCCLEYVLDLRYIVT